MTIAFQNSSLKPIRESVQKRNTLHSILYISSGYDCGCEIVNLKFTHASVCPEYMMVFQNALLSTPKPSPESFAVRTETLLLKAVRLRRKADSTKNG